MEWSVEDWHQEEMCVMRNLPVHKSWELTALQWRSFVVQRAFCMALLVLYQVVRALRDCQDSRWNSMRGEVCHMSSEHHNRTSIILHVDSIRFRCYMEHEPAYLGKLQETILKE